MFTISHDYYGILGVSEDATEEEIRSQYKKLMKEHHPDQYVGLRKQHEAAGEDLLKVIDEKIRRAEEMCKLINEAFEVLIDPEKRKQYDEQIYEPAVAKPEISIHPVNLTFDSLTEGQRKTLSFTIENKGGPVGNVGVDWENTKPDWGELVIEPDPNTTFPINVTVKVDTVGIPSGPKYEKVQVTVDGEVHLVEVYLAVEVVAKVVAPMSSPRAIPTGPAPAPPSGGSSKSKVWGVFVAVGILAAVLFCGLPVIVENEQRAREKEEILENFPIEITEARRIRCVEEFPGDDLVESRVGNDTFCIVYSVRNVWGFGANVLIAGDTPIHGDFYNFVVDTGASYPCSPYESFSLDPGEEVTYVCFEPEDATLETFCLDVWLADSENTWNYDFLNKTICSEVVSIG